MLKSHEVLVRIKLDNSGWYHPRCGNDGCTNDAEYYFVWAADPAEAEIGWGDGHCSPKCFLKESRG